MRSQSESRIEALKAGCASLPHGVRGRYVSGCRCMICRAANSRYQSAREQLKKVDGADPLVPTAAALEHLRLLSHSWGVGYKSVADAASVSRTGLAKVIAGTKQFLRRSTLERILAVDLGAVAGGALISAGPTWHLLNGLLGRGYSKGQLAKWLGRATPALQIRKDRVTARTAAEVVRMCALLEAGKLRRD